VRTEGFFDPRKEACIYYDIIRIMENTNIVPVRNIGLQHLYSTVL
jgi:hypothetical protein